MRGLQQELQSAFSPDETHEHSQGTAALRVRSVPQKVQEHGDLRVPPAATRGEEVQLLQVPALPEDVQNQNASKDPSARAHGRAAVRLFHVWEGL